MPPAADFMKSFSVQKPTQANIYRAARVLRRGGLVAFPTETVYGLGADAFNEKAVCRIFEVKKRPSFDPLIVHVSSFREAMELWSEVPDAAKLLMSRFWPGPLSIVLPKSGRVPDVVTSGLPTVAVRMPAQETALRLIREAGRPLAAPSANLFGYTSPTSAASVAEDFGKEVGMILDGGPCSVGVESTVVKIEKRRIYLLRPGCITAAEIEKTTGLKVIRISQVRKLEAPGQMKSHYAPSVPMILAGESEMIFMKKMRRVKKEREATGSRWPEIARISFSGKKEPGLFCREEILSPRKDIYEAASRLFQAIRKLDKMKPRAIVAFPFPGHGIGAAIADRLEKASGGRRGWGSFADALHRMEIK